MKTPKKLIDSIVFDSYVFKNLKQAEKYIRKHGTADYVAIDGILYTMEEYDESGKEISYYNKRTGNTLLVETRDRYRLGFGDANLSIEQLGYYRNDISYID